MKYIIAIIQPDRLDEVVEALTEAEINLMTVSDVMGRGRQKGVAEIYRSHVEPGGLLRKVKLEIAVNDQFVSPTIDASSGRPNGQHRRRQDLRARIWKSACASAPVRPGRSRSAEQAGWRRGRTGSAAAAAAASSSSRPGGDAPVLRPAQAPLHRRSGDCRRPRRDKTAVRPGRAEEDEMDELAAGIHRWTAPHPEWRPKTEEVQSYALVAGEALLLVDPLVPAKEDERRAPLLAQLELLAAAATRVELLVTVPYQRAARRRCTSASRPSARRASGVTRSCAGAAA